MPYGNPLNLHGSCDVTFPHSPHTDGCLCLSLYGKKIKCIHNVDISISVVWSVELFMTVCA